MFATHTLLTHFLSQAARTWPHAPAVSDARHTLSYPELQDAATRIARALHARGVTAGDRVVLSCPNSVAFVAGYWGILASGAVAVPLNPGTPASKFAFVLQDCTPAAILADPSTSDVVETALERTGDPIPVLCAEIDASVTAVCATQNACEDLPTPSVLDQDLATIIYTSGSTGTPKGVMLSHLNMTSAARSVASYLGYHAEDRIFCAVPMTFDYGLHQITMAALTGAEIFAEPGFGQPLFALQHLAQSRATVFPVVPTMVPLIAPLADRFDLGAVRLVSSTAAALHPELIDTLETALPGATVFSMYGLTECHRCTYLPPSQLTHRRDSVGIAIPNTELWVVDAEGQARRRNATGELVIRGSTVMTGYWNNPEATAQRLRPGPLPGEQVLYTGDTCRLDAEGYLYFVGRNDDILKIAGEKVAPSEVEAALIAHPAVAEVCVLGADHPVQGQICLAHVALAPGAECTSQDLVQWCKSRLDSHAVPARIAIHAEMPRTQNGKLDRAALHALAPTAAPRSRARPLSPAH
ncbi:acyl--CoA ligase [Epibacterium sp. MM17-32]|uniref:class I adenylate-forming enzyme family protein n=1 Tax=Epibacterium sp. MM17-32 TaxID=2917734 RepID=UPI001EF69858|nr:class I adenylate-forming enzyme family protein [Epibacterium sp. MM17-32]MCG7626767.1 acyl--CoA ligase [Epibacterium sp. MM17-32]